MLFAADESIILDIGRSEIWSEAVACGVVGFELVGEADAGECVEEEKCRYVSTVRSPRVSDGSVILVTARR